MPPELLDGKRGFTVRAVVFHGLAVRKSALVGGAGSLSFLHEPRTKMNAGSKRSGRKFFIIG